MIKEILQTENSGLGNYKTDQCIGYDYIDAMVLPKEIPGIPETFNNERNFLTYAPLATKLIELFPETKYILELGSGSGALSYHYRKMKPDVSYVTTDINRDVFGNGVVDDSTHFTIFTDRDFQFQNTNDNMKFDLIVSFEHFEHIPVERIEIFLNNIKKHCHENTLIVATVALWGDGPGSRHPLVMSESQWIDLLENNGFELKPDLKFLTPEIIPFNFRLSDSAEFVFKIKQK